MKLAIVDDNKLEQELIFNTLRTYEHERNISLDISSYSDGNSFLNTYVPGDFDLIFMDIQMPKMDGYKATQAIRNLSDKDKASIPIIAMTANAFEEDKRDAIAAGMNGHIAKPIQVDKLLSILSEVIRKQSLYRLKNGTMGKTDDVFADNVIY